MPEKKKNPWLVETRQLTHIYGDGEVRALDDVNLRIGPREIVAVMGPSGSGKSTLLNMLGALDAPTSGQVFVNGHDLETLDDVDTFRAKTVGFVFQLHNLLPTLTAQENVEVPMMGHASPGERAERASHLLELVGLSDRKDYLPNQLSGGQRQRVAVARALANNPPLVLADEPTGNLDSAASKELIALLHELNRSQGTTFIVVTHDPAVARQTHRVIVMADGRIAREDIIGSPLEEDLRMWQHSGLGRRILAGDGEVKRLNLTPGETRALKSLLQKDAKKKPKAKAKSKPKARPKAKAKRAPTKTRVKAKPKARPKTKAKRAAVKAKTKAKPKARPKARPKTKTKRAAVKTRVKSRRKTARPKTKPKARKKAATRAKPKTKARRKTKTAAKPKRKAKARRK